MSSELAIFFPPEYQPKKHAAVGSVAAGLLCSFCLVASLSLPFLQLFFHFQLQAVAPKLLSLELHLCAILPLSYSLDDD